MEALQEAGILHVSPLALTPDEAPDEARELTPGVALTPDASQLRSLHAKLCRRLEALESVVSASARLQVRELTYLQVGVRVDALIERKAELSREIENLEAEREVLDPWGEFATEDLEALEAAGLRVVFAEMEEDEWLQLDRSIAHAVASVRGGVRRVVLFDPPGAVPGTLVGVPRASLRGVRQRLQATQGEVRAVQVELGRFAHYAPLIAERLRSLRDRMAVLSALDGAVSAGPVFALAGFLPREQVVDLQQALSPFDCAVQLEDAPKFDTEVPVKLRNGPLVSGFETVIEAFSGMRYGEKDFTWAVGLLFVTFGSLCLLDAGYGLMLAMVGVVLRVRGSRAMGSVLALTGVVAMAVGWMSGQFFGLVVGDTILRDSRPLLTLSSEPYHAFVFSLFVGMVSMLFSYAMAIWQRGFETEATGALLLVLCSLAAVYANLAADFVHPLWSQGAPSAQELGTAKLWGNRAAWLLLAGALSSWVAFPGQVFGKQARAGNVLWTLYSGATGFVQDVLSHMRLFGIALSGGIMALVVNEMAARLPLPIAALFAVVAHLFVFLLSLLSLYIHTNRLIFLEWGSKCIEGGSNSYSPLRRSSA